MFFEWAVCVESVEWSRTEAKNKEKEVMIKAIGSDIV